jgi:hypothetical protein
VKVNSSLCFFLTDYYFWLRHYLEVSYELHGAASLPPRREPLVPVTQEAVWAPEPVWTRWLREKFSAPVETRTSYRETHSSALYHLANPAEIIDSCSTVSLYCWIFYIRYVNLVFTRFFTKCNIWKLTVRFLLIQMSV